uniref:Putative ovule protein n=1 Tax=Solanum chacoense TaxID=4108 RepID=A0A0V0GFE6_SOLCH
MLMFFHMIRSGIIMLWSSEETNFCVHLNLLSHMFIILKEGQVKSSLRIKVKRKVRMRDNRKRTVK